MAFVGIGKSSSEIEHRQIFDLALNEKLKQNQRFVSEVF